MGLFYRRSVRLPGGFRLNLSSRGAGLSGGMRGARYSTRSGWRFTLPGSGLSWRPPRGRR